jgi:ankyrin repeat protein
VSAGGKCALTVVWACASVLLFRGVTSAVDWYELIKAGDLAAIKRVIEQGVNINKGSKYGFTPLHQATTFDNKEVAELLIRKGADINAKTSWGATPLHLAAQTGEKAVAEVLIANGADVNARDNDGRTPLHQAVRSTYSHYGVAELLIRSGADVNAKAYPPLQGTPY